MSIHIKDLEKCFYYAKIVPCVLLCELIFKCNVSKLFLQAGTLNYIIDHPLLVESEVFDDLPDHLQSEVEDLVAWQGYDNIVQAS